MPFHVPTDDFHHVVVRGVPKRAVGAKVADGSGF